MSRLSFSLGRNRMQSRQCAELLLLRVARKESAGDCEGGTKLGAVNVAAEDPAYGIGEYDLARV